MFTKIIINDIKIYDEEENELIVEKYNNETIFFFDNDVQDKSLEKLTTPLPAPVTYYYATKIDDEKNLKFIIHGECYQGVTLKDVELIKTNGPRNKNEKENYLSKNIVTTDSKFEITICVKTPETSTCFILDNFLINVNGITKEGYTDGPSNYTNEYYGIFLKDINSINSFEKTINDINYSISTEFKLCSDVTKLIKDIKDKNYSSGYYFNNIYYLFDIEYMDNIIDYNTYDDYEYVCYSVSQFYDHINEEMSYYVRQIYCSLEGYTLFGLSINSSLEDVQAKMQEMNYYESIYEESISLVRYSYEYDYGYVQFVYNTLTNKINSFMIDVIVDPSQYYYH